MDEALLERAKAAGLDEADLEQVGLAEEILEALQEILPQVERLADLNPAFRAYHAAAFQGEKHGWMGSGFLVDDLRKIANADELLEAIEEAEEEEEED